MSFLLLSLIFSSCLSAETKEIASERIVVSRKRIKSAVELCATNGKVKEIQVKPRELIVCGNGAVFRR